MKLPSFLLLLFTWEAHHRDGLEQFGFPVVIFERGGFSGEEHFYPGALVVDLVIVVCFAATYAELTRDGYFTLVEKLRNWGTPRETE